LNCALQLVNAVELLDVPNGGYVLADIWRGEE
jgi:hypothetical protein